MKAFVKIRKFATGLRPNPAEDMIGPWHDMKPPRLIGNFGDRRTPRNIFNIYAGETMSTNSYPSGKKGEAGQKKGY